MKTPTPKRKPPTKKVVVGTIGRKPSDTHKKKGPTSAKKSALKSTKKIDGVPSKKTRTNDRGAQASNGAPFSQAKSGPLSTAQQQHLAIAELRSSDWATTHTMRAAGIHHPAGRIKELRDKFGFDIETTLVDSWDSDGFEHRRVARYRLVSDPPQLGLDFGREAANDPGSLKKGGTQ
ncbi:helix-turn-helix domain-containing protein [Variovorax sp. RB3P1]|uniref:helix-turn-helix domain-containing protein n=1 Tax=Variovorax sp. RB3P1 TaxID=3443732 RepID=UPI003F4596BF